MLATNGSRKREIGEEKKKDIYFYFKFYSLTLFASVGPDSEGGRTSERGSMVPSLLVNFYSGL